MKLYAVRMSVIYKCSLLRVMTFKVAAYVILCDLLWLGLVLGSWCGSSGVGLGGGVMSGGVSRGESRIMLGNMVSIFSVVACVSLRVCYVTCFGLLGRVLGSWCGSSGVWLVGSLEWCQGLCWRMWCVRRISGGCYGILYKGENVVFY